MRMHRIQAGYRRGTSLVEVGISLMVFMVMSLGWTYYRYLRAAEIRINEGCSLSLYVDAKVEGKNSSSIVAIEQEIWREY
jgi:hypothetical protein